MMSDTNLTDKLLAYVAGNYTALHMPGHKRNLAAAPYLAHLGGKLDITEIEGFDNLHQAEGVLLRSMEAAAALWGSSHSRYLVGGSSAGILAGIRAACQNGDAVLVARNSHKSVYHAIELNGLRPTYLVPPLIKDEDFYGAITARQVDSALNDNPDIKLVIITSPTFEGVISELAAIAGLCHERNIPLLVDEAHGAHLDLSPHFTGGAVAAGADIAVQSLHKTLPALTQTAIIHLNSRLIAPQELDRQLNIFQSSSPSYLLMASADGAVNLIHRQGEKLFAQWSAALDKFREACADLQNLKIITPQGAFDNSKIIVSCRRTDQSGAQLAAYLRDNFHIQIEMACASYLVAMTGLTEPKQSLPKLAAALHQADKICRLAPCRPQALPPLPEQALAICAALNAPTQSLPLAQAAGQICAEYLWAYPPGIPLIVPGERISAEALAAFAQMHQAGVRLYGSSGAKEQNLLVCANSRP